MLSKLKAYGAAIAAGAIAILYALFRVEKAKRKQVELEEKISNANEKAEKQSKQALDYAITERDKQASEDRQHAQKAREELESYEIETLDDPIPDNIIRLLNQNADKKRTNQDS